MLKGVIIKSNNIINELKILTYLPIVIFSVIFLFFIVDTIKQLKQLEIIQMKSKQIQNISKFITDLQQERGISSGYLASDGKQFKIQLAKIRNKTNKAAIRMKFNVKVLNEIRTKIDNFNISPINEFSQYTKIIKKLQLQYYKLHSKHIKDLYILKQIHGYINLSFMKEALGEIRGSFNGILSSDGNFNKELLYNAIHAKGVYDTSFDRFRATASDKLLNKLYLIINSKDYKYIMNIFDKYASLKTIKITENPQEWFIRSTNVINKIDKLEKEYLISMNNYIKIKSSKIKTEIIIEILILLSVFIFVFWISYKLKNHILRSISILEQYKNAVDRSSIVSKTDKRGIITYVNDKFCDMSEYSRDELIGKSHNIVRHPDMQKTTFKDMWQHILDKKPWSGIIKNKTKSGDYYIVEATINPILNHKGEIEEFIAIRNDITDKIKLQDELERTQEELIFRMGEIGETRSQETGFHVKRVAKYSELLAKFYGLNDIEIKYLTIASPMHDIGKVGIPDDILKKPGKLNEEEWKIMKTHSEIGHKLFEDSNEPLLQTAAIIAYEHHEKYNGTGYPRGLKGENIHIYGRITALADVFDALGSDRCYKKAWDDEKIFNLLKEERGKHFDPQLVDIFFEHLDEFLAIRDKFSEKSTYIKEN